MLFELRFFPKDKEEQKVNEKERREKGDVRDLNGKWNIAWTEHQTERQREEETRSEGTEKREEE